MALSVLSDFFLLIQVQKSSLQVYTYTVSGEGCKPPSLPPQYAQLLTTPVMLGAFLLWYSLIIAEALQGQTRFISGNVGACAKASSPADRKITVTCEKIAQSVSSKSQVFYPGEPRLVGLRCALIDSGFLDSTEFNFDISHWANSSSQVSVCSVEPGTPHDVATIVNSVIFPSALSILLTFRLM